jgi:hypothetical protein
VGFEKPSRGFEKLLWGLRSRRGVLKSYRGVLKSSHRVLKSHYAEVISCLSASEIRKRLFRTPRQLLPTTAVAAFQTRDGFPKPHSSFSKGQANGTEEGLFIWLSLLLLLISFKVLTFLMSPPYLPRPLFILLFFTLVSLLLANKAQQETIRLAALARLAAMRRPVEASEHGDETPTSFRNWHSVRAKPTSEPSSPISAILPLLFGSGKSGSNRVAVAGGTNTTTTTTITTTTTATSASMKTEDSQEEAAALPSIISVSSVESFANI